MSIKDMEPMLKTIRDDMIERLTKIKDGKEKTPIWSMPWESTFPKNMYSKQQYTGINMVYFSILGFARQWASPYFITYKQCKLFNEEHGTNIHVRKDEKSIKGIRIIEGWKPSEWKQLTENTYQSQRSGDIKSEDDITRTVARTFNVFNAGQLENCPEEFLLTKQEPIKQNVLNFINQQNSIIKDAPSAYYSPSEDYIGMPPLSLFKSEDDYWATNLHEHGHWTGHKSRLNRDQSGKQGSEKYSKEELIAEMTSAFLCSYFNLDVGLQHTAYISSYLKILNDDLKILRDMTKEATYAFTYLMESKSLKAVA